jgi:hypothetical protein
MSNEKKLMLTQIIFNFVQYLESKLLNMQRTEQLI